MIRNEIVTLTDSELRIARWVAAQIEQQAARNKQQPRNGHLEAGPKSLEERINACITEIATAKALNLFWSGNIGEIGRTDVGGWVEVKWIDHSGKTLAIPPGKDPKPPYVCACYPGHGDEVDLRGWAYGFEVMSHEPEIRGGPKKTPAHYLPKPDLRAMIELKAWLVLPRTIKLSLEREALAKQAEREQA